MGLHINTQPIYALRLGNYQIRPHNETLIPSADRPKDYRGIEWKNEIRGTDATRGFGIVLSYPFYQAKEGDEPYYLFPKDKDVTNSDPSLTKWSDTELGRCLLPVVKAVRKERVADSLADRTFKRLGSILTKPEYAPLMQRLQDTEAGPGHSIKKRDGSPLIPTTISGSGLAAMLIDRVNNFEEPDVNDYTTGPTEFRQVSSRILLYVKLMGAVYTEAMVVGCTQQEATEFGYLFNRCYSGKYGRTPFIRNPENHKARV